MDNTEESIATLPHEECLKLAEGFHEDETIYYELASSLRVNIENVNNGKLLDDVIFNENEFKTSNFKSFKQNLSSYLTCFIHQVLDCTSRKFISGARHLSPRLLQRSCSKSFSYAKLTMKLIRRVLLICCLFIVCYGGVLLVKVRKENAEYLQKVAYLNRTSQFLKWKLNLQKLKPKLPTKKVVQRKRNSLGHPFNPDNWDNRTANLHKHYVILYWSQIRGHIARIQTKKEYEKDQHVWPYTYVGENCPVSCEITNNRSRAKDADAFVVHSRLTDVWDFPPFKYLAPWILQNNENPVYTPALSDPRIMNKFNLLISYRLDSDFPSPIYPMPSLSKPIPFKDRLGDVLAVFSKCEAVRTEYMRQLMKYIDVHSYGACLKNKDGLIGLYGKVNGKYVFKDYKLVLTRFYKFSLVFMNQDCDYFVDDRLYHALETGSVPIYMGTNKIDEFLPGNLKNAVIKLSDFSSPQELANYLKYLSRNETAYNKYLEWKTQGLGDMNETVIGRWWKPKYPLFCQVCMRLSQGKLHPGLNVDTCRPRQFLDWNLYPPYGVDNSMNDPVTKTASIERTTHLFVNVLTVLIFIGSFLLLYFIFKICSEKFDKL